MIELQSLSWNEPNINDESGRSFPRRVDVKIVLGGPETMTGTWPLVVANVLAAPLIEMAPVLVRRVGTRGRLILSGIPRSLESEVRQAYQRLGMRHVRSETRSTWTVAILDASW